MEEVKKHRVPPFDGTNYNNWKFRMEVLLDEIGLKKHIESQILDAERTNEETTEAYNLRMTNLKKKDTKCKSQIIQRIADSHLEYAKDKSTAFDIWTELRNVFERRGVASQLLLRKRLLLMKFKSSTESLSSHLLKFESLVRELKSTGANMEETDVVCHLLLTMPSEYDVVVTALETLSKEALSLSFVKNRLLDEESKRKGGGKPTKGDVHSTAFTSSSDNRKNNTRDARNKQFNYRCYNCGAYGHRRSECKKPKQQPDGSRQDKKEKQANLANDDDKTKAVSFLSVINGEKNDNGSTWILDSGASEHLTKDEKHLQNVKLLAQPIKIRVAKAGVTLTANKLGTISGKTIVNGKEIEVTIKNVLYVPGLDFNLLSVSKLEANGFKVVFENREGKILKDNQVYAAAHRDHQIYVLEVYSPTGIASIAHVKEDAKIWHERYGHIGFNNLKKVAGMVDGIDLRKLELTNDKLCHTCVEGKQTKLPHDQERPRTKRPLQLIHSDLVGPITPESRDGNRYILTFIDDYTHFTVIYLLKKKSEVFHYFQIYEAMVTAHFNLKISRFRCDNGREYTSKEMIQAFQKKGIRIEYTIRYTPQQNGVAERMNRTILDKARCMILHSQLSKSFWAEAVLSPIYIINRSPTAALEGVVPAELWFDKKPDVRKLKVFGCIAYMHIPKELNPRKFDPRSKKCIMVGYTDNGYRLWCPEEQRIICSRDVIFDEKKFKHPQSVVETNIQEVLESEQEEAAVEEDEERGLSETESIHTEEEEETADNLKTTDEEYSVPRRSTRISKRPNYLQDYCVLALHAESYVEDIPNCYSEINSRDDREKWLKAVNEELKAIQENQTWSLTQLPSGRKAIDNKWIFKIKRDEDGNIQRYKARLVVKGCLQKKGFDYNETYAPVARLTTVRILLSTAVNEDLHVDQLDVKNAFLHGKLTEDIYMKQPEGCEDGTSRVCKLNKTLYGLKQSPRELNSEFNKYIKKIGLNQSEYDSCLFYKVDGKSRIYLLLYVDDIIIAGNDRNRINELKRLLEKRFSMKDLGSLRNFLGIKIERHEHGMKLSQSTYISNLLKRFGMEDSKPAKTPMEVKSSSVTTSQTNEIEDEKNRTGN